jgi:hypothetical protein
VQLRSLAGQMTDAYSRVLTLSLCSRMVAICSGVYDFISSEVISLNKLRRSDLICGPRGPGLMCWLNERPRRSKLTYGRVSSGLLRFQRAHMNDLRDSSSLWQPRSSALCPACIGRANPIDRVDGTLSKQNWAHIGVSWSSEYTWDSMTEVGRLRRLKGGLAL